MNKVYRTVFNEKTNTWVAVSKLPRLTESPGLAAT